DNNDIAPFKNILNEMYSKDISKKVHSSYLLKAQKGQFTGCLAPLNGHGPNYIRRRLEEEKIPCPTWWNRERGLRNTRTKWEKKDPENGRYMWDFSVIKDLLMNPVYTGAIASQKKDYRFKIGTIGEKKPEDWIVVEGQHEPLIDRMSFDIVQNKLKSRQRPGQTNEISLFAGL
uniref:recombinase family protein n=1 Tax=[Eubacterium] hominis TaxID=2764325 RepID=UPI0023DDDE6A